MVLAVIVLCSYVPVIDNTVWATSGLWAPILDVENACPIGIETTGVLLVYHSCTVVPFKGLGISEFWESKFVV